MTFKQFVKQVNEVDYQITKWVHENIGLNKNKFISEMPYYLGLLPYELYVLPGMFLAIFVMFYYKSFHPVQFHLLPHWFAFSISLYVKHNFQRVRPGCLKERPLDSLIDPKHCDGSTMYQSFPSGHTLIAVALATTLSMYLNDPTYNDAEKTFLGIPFYQPTIKALTVSFGFLVVVMISLHRIAYGYHYFGDVLLGALLGYCIGYASYTVTNTLRQGATPGECQKKPVIKVNTELGVAKEQPGEEPQWNAVQGVGMALSVIALVHFFLFKFKKLSQIQH